MIVYMGSTNTVCDLSVVAVSLIEEGYSSEEIVCEIIEFCSIQGVHVYKYDVEMMLENRSAMGWIRRPKSSDSSWQEISQRTDKNLNQDLSC